MLFFGIYLTIGVIVACITAYACHSEDGDMLELMSNFNMSDTMKYICIMGIWTLAWPFIVIGTIDSVLHDK